ncbi:MAG: FAD-binding oxidoreductase [Armatimonadota bacterium]
MEALLGPGRVTTTTLARWAVDGIIPRMIVRPADAAQVGAVLRLCGEVGAAVVPWGGGTAIDVGNPPRAADVILLTDRFSRVVDHDHSNLTVTVQAGAALGALARTLAGERQFLPLEPPRAEAATVGGTAAVNLNGPRRMLYGGARDLVIGIRVVQANGVEIKWGGKTVKNVAGYDMCKLFVGSMGTLGVLTELTLKVFPLPETSRTLLIWGRDLQAMLALAGRAVASPLLPVAVSVLNPAAGAALGRRSPALLIRAEGFEPAVARHERDITAWAAQADMEAQTLSGDVEGTAWRTIRDFGWQDGAAAVRLTTPAAAVAEVVDRLQALLPSGAAVVAHAGSGATWIRLDAADVSENVLSALRELAARHAGHLLLARGPRDLKATSDVWSPAPAALGVMRALKQAFDPQNIMNPGRFVAGL